MMNDQEHLDYNRIARAIQYIRDHFKTQPGLEEIAGYVHVSPFHFQRMFREWAGVSPKKFLQYISVEHAKTVLRENEATLFDAAIETGLSGTGRLHDLFIKIEGMTPGEYKNRGEGLLINYSYAQSPFGTIIIASTEKGICHTAFISDKERALHDLKNLFPRADFRERVDENQLNALRVFATPRSELPAIKLHLKGSDFQLKVWESLLRIPRGRLAAYGDIAVHINKPNASRAVGSAIANNPVAFLIPCHRVIRSTGSFGQYRWGNTRKTAIIGWEAARVSGDR